METLLPSPYAASPHVGLVDVDMECAESAAEAGARTAQALGLERLYLRPLHALKDSTVKEVEAQVAKIYAATARISPGIDAIVLLPTPAPGEEGLAAAVAGAPELDAYLGGLCAAEHAAVQYRNIVPNH